MSEDPTPPKGPFQGFRFEVNPEEIDQAVQRLRRQVESSFSSGRHTKVRITYRGQALGPDIPLAAFMVGQGATLWLTGPLTTLLVNLGAKAVLEVEFIHEADTLVQEGLALYLDGEVEAAEAKYREALGKRPSDPTALYNLGTLLRVTGRRDEALSVLREAAMGPQGHPDVIRAAEAVEKLAGPRKTL